MARRLSSVGLNLLHLVPRETGGAEVYARRLIRAIAEERPELELVAFSGREGAPVLRDAGLRVVEIPVNARSRVRRVLAEQSLLANAVRRARVDLLHNLFTTAPAFPGVPQVTTIHDLIYKRLPETHPGLLARGLSLLVPLAAKRSRRIIAVSEATKRDVVSLLGTPADSVDVVYEGPGMDVERSDVSDPLGLGSAPLVLTVSAKRPHKNLERLIEAFAALDGEPVLVVPGYHTPFEDGLRALAAERGVAGRVRFEGWLDDATLDALYRQASCFVFPSLAEGFGLPVLEAMLRGTPVACSDAGSLPEVAGDAARYFDPRDTGSITGAMAEVLRDPALRERLSQAGVERAAGFTWRECARGTLESYERTLVP